MKKSSKNQPNIQEFAREISNKYWPITNEYPYYQRCNYCDTDRMCRHIYLTYICKNCDNRQDSDYLLEIAIFNAQ